MSWVQKECHWIIDVSTNDVRLTSQSEKNRVQCCCPRWSGGAVKGGRRGGW